MKKSNKMYKFDLDNISDLEFLKYSPGDIVVFYPGKPYFYEFYMIESINCENVTLRMLEYEVCNKVIESNIYLKSVKKLINIVRDSNLYMTCNGRLPRKWELYDENKTYQQYYCSRCY